MYTIVNKDVSNDLSLAAERMENTLTGAVLRAALEANCLRGALPPVDLRAVCLVRAIRTGKLSGFSSVDSEVSK